MNKYEKMMALAKEAEKPMRAVKVKNIGDISESLLPAIKEIKDSLEKLDLNVDFKEVTTAIEKLKKSVDSMEMKPILKPEFKPTFKVENKMDQLKDVLSSLKEVKKAIDAIKLPDNSKEFAGIKESIDSLPELPVSKGRIKVEVDRVGVFDGGGIVPFETSSGSTKKARIDSDGHLQVDVIGGITVDAEQINLNTDEIETKLDAVNQNLVNASDKTATEAKQDEMIASQIPSGTDTDFSVTLTDAATAYALFAAPASAYEQIGRAHV